MTTETSKPGSNPQVLSSIPTLNINTSNVDATARERMNSSLLPTSKRLQSNEQANDLIERYNKACQLIVSNPRQAEDLFLKLIDDIQITEGNLLLLADCKLRLASLYPENSDERINPIASAKKDLDRVYENRSAWDSLGEEKKIGMYKLLRKGLQQFKDMTPAFARDNFIDFDIFECSKHIPLLTDFYDKLSEGDRLQGDRAREVYHQALEMIKSHGEPGYLLARAFGITSLALTYRSEDNNSLSLEALAQASVAYQQKEALFTSAQAKLTTLNLFCQLFDNLIQLFSGSEHLVTINTMLEKCKAELTRCQDSVTEDSPNVSKEPVDHWKTVRIAFAFGFAAFVIAGAFVLGRRYITRLN